MFTTTWDPGAEIAICDFNHGNPGLVGGMMLANEFCRLPYQVAGMAPPDVPRWGKAHKDFMRTWFRRSIVIMGPSQEMPVFSSRVQVDPKVRDYWGIPVARLSGVDHPHNIELCKFASDKAELWLKEAGAIQVARRQKTQSVAQRGPASGRNLPHGQRSRRPPWWTNTASSTTWTTCS